MSTDDESRDPTSRREDVETNRRAVEVADFEHETVRRRIALQILAVVVPWRDALPEMDLEERDLFRVRGHALLNYLDVAVMPYPDLQDALAAARAELASERPGTGTHQVH